MANISNAMMADLLDLKPSGIIRLEDKVMGGGVMSPQERDARRMHGLANQLGQQGLSGLGGLHDQDSYNRAIQQGMNDDYYRRLQDIEEMKKHFEERDHRLAEEAMRDPRNEGMMIQPIVDDMKRDIDKVDIRTYLQAKTDDWLRGVEL